MFRISDLLWLIALAALNLTLLKYFEPVIDLSPKFAGLIGLMPLFDLFALSLYVALTRRFRFTLSGGRYGEHRRFGRDVERAILSWARCRASCSPRSSCYWSNCCFPPLDQWIGVSKSSPETRGFLAGTLLVCSYPGH